MKISIITPFNKGVHFLKDYFMSLNASNYKDFEIVLALNGIQDDEKEAVDALIKEYSEHLEIQVIETEEDALDENLTEEDIHAKYEDGVLKVDLPKKEARKVPEKKQILIG